MELTKEYLDQALKAAVAPLASKEDLTAAIASSEQRIIKRIDDAQEELARMVSAGFKDLQRRLDVTEQVKEHERKLRLIADALHIQF